MFFIALLLFVQSAQAMVMPRERSESTPQPLPQPVDRLPIWSLVLLQTNSIRKGRTAVDLLRQLDNER